MERSGRAAGNEAAAMPTWRSRPGIGSTEASSWIVLWTVREQISQWKSISIGSGSPERTDLNARARLGWHSSPVEVIRKVKETTLSHALRMTRDRQDICRFLIPALLWAGDRSQALLTLIQSGQFFKSTSRNKAC